MRTTANVSLGIKRHLVLQIMSGNMDNLRMSISVKKYSVAFLRTTLLRWL